ncbi:MAG TPA: hypothetical protein VGX03_13675 [Candidatus Binatia bacterium]|jgi:hypothetical protein|nr:hypothetical protein [Candidatus Binatia bacterium]
MWLEELAWLWVPILAGAGVWMIRRLVTLTTEMRILRKRVEQLEQESREPDRDRRKVA